MGSTKAINAIDFEWDKTDAWIICGYTNMIFKYDFFNATYEFVAPLPENGIEYYDYHPRCVKYKTKVFCLPCRGSDIYIFDISTGKFRKIDLKNTDDDRINLDKLKIEGHLLYTISYGMKQIIVIDLEAEKIIKTYHINDCDGTLYKAVKCDSSDKVYAISDKNSVIYQYNLKQSSSKKIEVLQNSGIDEQGFTTIADVGEQLWLSGYNNKIYIFNTEKEILEKYIELPDDIKFYDYENSGVIYKDKEENDFYFYDCAAFDDTVWFIPHQTNKILYVNTKDYAVRELYMDKEEETDYSLSRIIKRKYEIVKKGKEGTLVLESYQNNCYYMINTADQTVKLKSGNVSYTNLEKLWKEYGVNRVFFSENFVVDYMMYSYGIAHKTGQNIQKEKMPIGSKIYRCISGN